MLNSSRLSLVFLVLGIVMLCACSSTPGKPVVTEPVSLDREELLQAQHAHLLGTSIGSLMRIVMPTIQLTRDSLDTDQIIKQSIFTFKRSLEQYNQGCLSVSKQTTRGFRMKLSSCSLDDSAESKANGIIDVSIERKRSVEPVNISLTFKDMQVRGNKVTGTLLSASPSGVFHVTGSGLTIQRNELSLTLDSIVFGLSPMDQDSGMLLELDATGTAKYGDRKDLALRVLDWQQKFSESLPQRGALAIQDDIGGVRRLVELFYNSKTPDDGTVEVRLNGLFAGVKGDEDLLPN